MVTQEDKDLYIIFLPFYYCSTLFIKFFFLFLGFCSKINHTTIINFGTNYQYHSYDLTSKCRIIMSFILRHLFFHKAFLLSKFRITSFTTPYFTAIICSKSWLVVYYFYINLLFFSTLSLPHQSYGKKVCDNRFFSSIKMNGVWWWCGKYKHRLLKNNLKEKKLYYPKSYVVQVILRLG